VTQQVRLQHSQGRRPAAVTAFPAKAQFQEQVHQAPPSAAAAQALGQDKPQLAVALVVVHHMLLAASAAQLLAPALGTSRAVGVHQVLLLVAEVHHKG